MLVHSQGKLFLQLWKLTAPDMCELARNSVLMSGFSREVKQVRGAGGTFKEVVLQPWFSVGL